MQASSSAKRETIKKRLTPAKTRVMSKTRYPSNGNAPAEFGFAAADEYKRHDLLLTVSARRGTWLTRAKQDLVIISTREHKTRKQKKHQQSGCTLSWETAKPLGVGTGKAEFLGGLESLQWRTAPPPLQLGGTDGETTISESRRAALSICGNSQEKRPQIHAGFSNGR